MLRVHLPLNDWFLASTPSTVIAGSALNRPYSGTCCAVTDCALQGVNAVSRYSSTDEPPPVLGEVGVDLSDRLKHVPGFLCQ
jgi:hypothetical protein